MLYDYKKCTYYSFDFHSLINSFKKDTPLQNQNEYLNAWERILITLSNHENNPINIDSIISYQYTFNCYDSQVFKLHFNISTIEKSIIKRRLPYQTYSSDLFGTDDSSFQYTYEPYKDYHLESSSPIILVPFPLGLNTKFIVIDGNHRVSAKVEHSKEIPAIIYDPRSSIDFLSPINWAFYIFFNEFYFFNIEVIQGKIFSNLLPLSNIHHTFSSILK